MEIIQKRPKNRPKTPKLDATGRPPFDATLRPTSKTRRAVLAALAMARLVFSVGFGNISLPLPASAPYPFGYPRRAPFRPRLSAGVGNSPAATRLGDSNPTLRLSAGLRPTPAAIRGTAPPPTRLSARLPLPPLTSTQETTPHTTPSCRCGIVTLAPRLSAGVGGAYPRG